MYQLKNLEDTIVAISTPMGHGGISVVRLSGKESVSIADKMFQANNKMKPSKFPSFTVHYGWVCDEKGKTIDEALLSVMRGPKSYTKEDIIEISSHGGVVSVKGIVATACELGARLAEPGEFTKRAFLNGPN